MLIGYARVSTEEQNLDRQREALAQYGIERWYKEKVSGKDTKREQLQEMLEFAREAEGNFDHTQFTIVDVLPREDIEACKELAERTGVYLKIRKFSGGNQ